MATTLRLRSAVRLPFLIICLIQLAQSEDLTLRQAIDLALTHSNTMGIATADQQRAYEVYREAHGAYTPSVTLGSAVGYAYGFPLSLEGAAPTVFSVTAQSYLLNASQKEFVRAAKAEWSASGERSRDARDKVLLDIIATYYELNKWERRLPILNAEQKVTRDMQYTARERVKEGVEASVEETKAKLKVAQSNLRMVQAQGSADVLRHHLAELTGLPAQSIATVTASLPPLPAVDSGRDAEPGTLDSLAPVKSADLRAQAEQLRARGEHKAFYPTADVAMQYGRINPTLTNYQQFLQRGSFVPNNVTAGIVIRFSFLNATQRARAEAADAAAIVARKEAVNTKAELANRIAKLRSMVRQLAAARDVAQVQYELAQAQLESAQVRMQAQAAPLRELQDASLQAVESSGGLMDSELDLEGAELQLLLVTGELESWSEVAK